MNARELMRTLVRHWPIALVVALLTVGAAVYLSATSGVYTTRTSIAFVLPGGTSIEDDGSEEPGIITFAATVAREVDDNVLRPRYASADARAYGTGVRQGVFVGVPDVGGQWTVSYRRAELYIDIVGPTREWVEQQQKTAISKVIVVADAQQDAIGIERGSRVQYSVEPLSTDIEHIAASRSSLLMAFAALGVASLMVASFVARWWDARRARRLLRASGLYLNTEGART